MTLEKLLSQMVTGTKQITERYSEYGAPVHEHDHHFYYSYEPSAHGHVATPKHNYGGGHKSGASMSALTLLAFLFFLHILQQCIKDHMMEMSATQPIMVMTAGREGEEAISKSVSNKIDKAGIKQIEDLENERTNAYKQNKITAAKNPYSYDDSTKKQLLKVYTSNHTRKYDDEKNNYVFKNNANRSSYFSGFVSAMEEDEE